MPLPLGKQKSQQGEEEQKTRRRARLNAMVMLLAHIAYLSAAAFQHNRLSKISMMTVKFVP